MAAAASYSGWPGPCHFVAPFKSLVVVQAMLMLSFLTVTVTLTPVTRSLVTLLDYINLDTFVSLTCRQVRLRAATAATARSLQPCVPFTLRIHHARKNPRFRASCAHRAHARRCAGERPALDAMLKATWCTGFWVRFRIS